MAHYMGKIEKLAAAAGVSTNPLEKAQLILLENEVANLTAENEAKRGITRLLEERLEKSKMRLNTEKDVDENLQDTIDGDMDRFKQKNHILLQYLETLKSDDFLLNKILVDQGRNNNSFTEALGGMVDKARAIKDETIKLRDLQTRCDELRQKTGQ